jgi:hypothetical protein
MFLNLSTKLQYFGIVYPLQTTFWKCFHIFTFRGAKRQIFNALLRKDLLIEIFVKRNHWEAELEYHNNLIRMMSTSWRIRDDERQQTVMYVAACNLWDLSLSTFPFWLSLRTLPCPRPPRHVLWPPRRPAAGTGAGRRLRAHKGYVMETGNEDDESGWKERDEYN